MVEIEDLCDPEWAEWYRMTPEERWRAQPELWAAFLALGGSLEPEPDTQSPFYDQAHRVHSLLMGGQACVLYGAAEFSRDIHLAVVADPDNLIHLRAAFDELGASIIAVPPLDPVYLNKGHAVHAAFGDRATGRMRIDVMSRMRGVDSFDALWQRRTTLTLDDLGDVDLLALPDLVAAKKTQRDKDWPMVRRLVEVNYLTFRAEPTPQRIEFWLRELRTPALLVEVASRFPDEATMLVTQRALLTAGLAGDEAALVAGLTAEEAAERAADRAYWEPLRQELEVLRRRGRG